jgi:hypothetical protein
MNLGRIQMVRTTVATAGLCVLLASPVVAGYAPKINWAPGGPASYGDPDIGGGGISLLRLVGHTLVMSIRRLASPGIPVVAIADSYPTQLTQD